jgi:hypothetical protein
VNTLHRGDGGDDDAGGGGDDDGDDDDTVFKAKFSQLPHIIITSISLASRQQFLNRTPCHELTIK